MRLIAELYANIGMHKVSLNNFKCWNVEARISHFTPTSNKGQVPQGWKTVPISPLHARMEK
jgi:hypothetical protein